MNLGVPRATLTGASTVAATPPTVRALRKLGYDVLVEAGAGARASLPDALYEAEGAMLTDAAGAWGADVVLLVQPLTVDDVNRLSPGAAVIAPMAPAANPQLVTALAARGVTALALDAVPRISRAQALDILSTNSNIAGYRAVIEAAEAYSGMFGGQVTAAGKTAPATVFVIGAGVAGLAAIGAASSLGAQVRAFDVRPEAGEQIASMGGTPVVAPQAQQEIAADGYAKPLTPEQQAAAMDVYAAETATADVVITTALVRGSAPTTITSAMVEAMRPGSVIVDLAASGGGNCEETEPGERIVTRGGVTIIGDRDLTAAMPRHTSQLLGTNIVNLLTLMTPGKDGQLVLDLDDVVVRGMTVTAGDEVLWPPPPVQVSAAPAATTAPAPTAEELAARAAAAEEAARGRARRRMLWYALGAVLLALGLSFSPGAFLGHFWIFALAVVIGFYVISQVSHSLHTPLMAQTNAISGIILVGALLQLGSDNPWVTGLAFVAAAVASINIFGGFLVTYRMLGMFRTGDAK
ncbi:MAG: Re/Si-specific NAD(P)(+) transhydrogenase subunit alpha [Salana multivorans]|uniref:Re/Si-specific NAD(P)(+) transhydrogenase subunit alpha n=1 Tax=Salana multivorans TaxID=120377 RepID=UPI0009648490|nr:Re/Si-specific NAD(P)(+) transhydrogenase subunit alpha [Salana multivorans]MBN8882007.1 Re/Si-specific NAD(P)(+) transhydrogenase subunit alpha [Salana multivorans]OJX94697.1 MAG: NAD(P) transhydrogenase subunit alpha [Micrococcales bacterium 73-15]